MTTQFMKSAVYICLFFLTLTSCSLWGPQPSFEDDFITYSIKRGSHEIERNTTPLFKGSSLKFQAVFDSTCMYKTIVPENQLDINKLMGFSDCGDHHQNNSARFGWSWHENALHIYAYNYVNGERQNQDLGIAEINKLYTYEIRISGNNYIFTFDGRETTMPRHCSGSVGISYKLLPYFGGDEPAPQDIKIKIRNL